MGQSQMNQTVTMSEIADAAGVSKPTASIWRTRYPDTFPDPLPESSPNRPLFALPEIEQWYRQQFPQRKPLGLANRAAARIHIAMMSIMRGALDPTDAAAAIIGLLAWQSVADYANTHETVTWNGATLPAAAIPAFPGSPASDSSLAPRDYLHDFGHARHQLRDAGLDAIALLIEPLTHESLDQRWVSDRVPALVRVIESLDTSDIADTADALISDSQSGQHLSSPLLADLMAILVHADHDSAWDPAVGNGNLLAAAHKSNPKSQLTGTDISPVAAAISTVRAYLNQWPATINVGDAFFEPSKTYDAVLIDPPLGARLDALATEHLSQELNFPAIPSSRSEIAWVCLGAARLTKIGAAAVVTAGSTTFARGAIAEVRRALVADGHIEAIIRLPRIAADASWGARNQRRRNVFRYDTAVELYVWVIKPRGSFESITFVDGEQLLGESENETIRNIVAAVEAPTKPEGAIAVSVLDVLRRPDFPLNPDAWLPTDEITPAEHLDLLRRAASQCRATIAGLHLPLPDISLADTTPPAIALTGVAEVIRSRPIPSEGIQAEPGPGLVPVVRPSHTGSEVTGYVAAEDNTRYLQPGDVIVHDGPSRPIATVWRGDEPSVPHPFTTIVRADPTKVDSDFLRWCMTGPSAAATRTGTTIKRLNLRDATIPKLPISRQREIADAISHGQALIDQVHTLADAAIEWRDHAATLASLGSLEVGSANSNPTSDSEK